MSSHIAVGGLLASGLLSIADVGEVKAWRKVSFLHYLHFCVPLY